MIEHNEQGRLLDTDCVAESENTQFEKTDLYVSK